MLFRRQFLLTPADATVDGLSDWPSATLRRHRIVAHPDVALTSAASADGAVRAVMIGFAISPANPKHRNADILRDMLAAAEGDTPATIARSLANLAGRFAMLVETDDDTLLFHDPGGFRAVCYTTVGGRFFAGSQPLILARAIPLAPGPRHALFEQSRLRTDDLEYWLPSGVTLYENVETLVPNHYLSVKTGRQHRYWPTEPIQPGDEPAIAEASADLLRRLMLAGVQRMPLALAVTSGWDSRLLLAASREVADRLFCFTFIYRNIQPNSRDIRVPRRMLASLGLEHHVIDCRVPPDNAFRELYERNASMAHWHDWGEIASGIRETWPAERVSVRGGGSEICRCSYHAKAPPGDRSAETIFSLMPAWLDLPFAAERVRQWHSQAEPVASQFNIDLLDLYYWEQRMGSWQAQNQVEWDLVQEVYSPFAHRGLIERMLSVPAARRCEPDYPLHRRIGTMLWPEAMRFPINPPENFRQWAKSISSRLGLGSLARKLRRRLVAAKRLAAGPQVRASRDDPSTES